MKVGKVGFVYSEHYHRDNVGREAAIKKISDENDTIIAKFSGTNYIKRVPSFIGFAPAV